MKVKHIAHKEGKGGKAILIGVVIALISTVVAVGVIAWLTNKEYISGNILIIPMGIQFLGAMTGCAATCKLHKDIKAVAVTMGIYYVLLLAVTIVAFDGAFSGIWRGVISVIIGAATALLLGKGGDKTSRRNRKFLRSR